MRVRNAWLEAGDLPERPPLGQDARVDVCVVGAGVAGLSAAWCLAREGRRVMVLDHGRVGGGETHRTTAHLASAMDDRFVELERLHGRDGARLAAESHAAAIDRIESIVAEEDIACDFDRVDGYLFSAPGRSPAVLSQELAAARRARVDVEMVARAPIDGFDTGPCLRFPRQGQVHPVKYMHGLAAAVERMGGVVHGRTHVTNLHGGPEAEVLTRDGPVVRARAVIVATNSPINNRFALHTRQVPYRTFVIAAPVPRNALTRALYWDDCDPYHYVRLEGGADPTRDWDLLIVGGEDARTGGVDDDSARFARLEAWARARWPMMGTVDHQWTGQVYEPVDGLAFIGRNPLDADNVFVVTGDSGQGMTHGTIAGMLLTDLICGRSNPWAKLYDPARVRLASASEYARDNLQTVAQYAEWLTPGEVPGLDAVGPGQGAVIRRGLGKLAVYRDEAGVVSVCDATCSHLGCVVGWNHTERAWECPCHGSRFDCHGRVVNGPAAEDLRRLDVRAATRKRVLEPA